jgi:nitroimidazol reductase NimA-like FMN-containing flavoprotein (pyridoxamine 5'-phosphate oxidase superfamily)
MMTTLPFGTSRRFQELGRQQCYQLLATQEVARVARQAADALQILPVTYALFEGAIYFRTSPHSIVSELARPTEVALEVDELDEERRTGWSVVVHGRSASVAPLENLSQRWELDSLMPWPAGLRTLVVRVVPFDISGRLLRRYVDM